MDLSMYPNLATIVQQLGGIKKTIVNKKRLQQSEEEFARIPADFLMKIEQEIPQGVKVFTNYITPSAFIILELHTLRIIPSRDVIWIYPSITTMRMNFIPYSKQHSLFMQTRTGEAFNLGLATTGGFSKKRPLDVHIDNIASVVSESCPGMLLGWSEEIAKVANKNYAALVQAVDEKNSIQ